MNTATILINELARRCDKNPRYSLRSFASHLGLDPGNLSRAMRGQTMLSLTYRKKIAEVLALSPQERSALDLSTKRSVLNTSKSRKEVAAANKFIEIEQSMFETISDPLHYEILELTATENFRPSQKWVANRLGVPAPRVTAAINRLLRLGLLKIDADGGWKKFQPKIKTSSGTSAALRHHQKKILAASSDAVERVPISERCNVSMTMPIDPEKIEWARTKIEKFVAKMCNDLSSGRRKEVYQMGVFLFPRSRRNSDE